MIKWFAVAACVLALILIAIRPTDTVRLEVVPFATAGGWGYNIQADGKTYIHQDRIPVLAGNHAFRSKEDAMSVGRLMMKKLAARQSPAISEQELRALNIR
ncbi:DUF4907 domain-containing protein [Chitinophaga horti]|uniref:DUF4907 domain-containing protein n=1 Tax=Chitinophaga horti TaxID=2920382 RepID=A0ABY6J6I0_9BACT|nr:DUF4907 domain-containing protein [Chitinophaga horti]UYQ93857.1 DUF4907 domain-containing protein [Chitinophaga horti]